MQWHAGREHVRGKGVPQRVQTDRMSVAGSHPVTTLAPRAARPSARSAADDRTFWRRSKGLDAVPNGALERAPVAVGRRPSGWMPLGELTSAHPQDDSTERDLSLIHIS